MVFTPNSQVSRDIYGGYEEIWINNATIFNCLDLLMYCHENNRGKNWKHSLRIAVFYNHLDIVEWLVSNNLRGTDNIINSCASSTITSVNLLDWLHEKKFDGDITSLSSAVQASIRTKSTEKLQWLLDHDYGCNGNSLVQAITYDGKDLFIAKWLLKKKVYYDERAFDKACELGKFYAVKFLYENTDVKCTKLSMEYAVRYNFLDIVKFLYKYVPNSYCKQKFTFTNESTRWLLENKNKNYNNPKTMT
jgi:hypothetical protein